jgi:M6 family metalloprotease-like protein
MAFGVSVAAQEPGNDLSDYQPVAKAVTAKVGSVRGAISGYLGVVIARNKVGKLAITDVQSGSGGEQAGLKPGDELVQAAGQPVVSSDGFRELLQAKGAGESILIKVLREGKPLELTAKLAAVSKPMKLNTERVSLGAQVAEAKDGEGAVVERVSTGSPAANAGVKVGDVILKINGEQLTRPGELTDAVAEKKPGDTLTLVLRREGKESEVKVQLTADSGRGFPGGSGGRGGAAVPFNPPLWRKEVFRLAVILIEYPDVKHNDKIPLTEWEHALFSRGVYLNKNNATDQQVSGSLNDWFHEQSCGGFRFEGKVFNWVELSKKRMDYMQGSGTSNRTGPLVEALDKLLARDGKDVLKDFDGLFCVYAGERAGTNRGAVYYPHAGMALHQNKRWLYVMTPEGGSKMTTLPTFVRECAQILGLPSLAARTENAGSEGCGVWCVMSDAVRGGKPQHLCAWCKEQLGWLQPVVIDPTVKQKLILSPIEDSKTECVKVLVKPDGSEYLLLENRRKKGFDADLPGEGLLIWRVVDNRPVLEEAHGVEGAQGPRVLLEHVPYPSPANNAFTPNTTPSSQSPKGGGLPVNLTDIRRLPDGRVAFQVGVEYR